MKQIVAAASAAGVLLCASPLSSGQEALPPDAGVPPATPTELRELRDAVHQQTRHIHQLTQQIMKLTQAIEGRAGSGTVTSGAPAAGAPAAPPTPTPPGAEEAPAPAPTAEPEVRRAEAAAPGPKHVVAKGETLTSIAKQYNIPLPELQKLNKIRDDRKLQIGQTLNLPPNTPTPEPSTEKKENQ